jgi:hypothetical protein
MRKPTWREAYEAWVEWDPRGDSAYREELRKVQERDGWTSEHANGASWGFVGGYLAACARYAKPRAAKLSNKPKRKQ